MRVIVYTHDESLIGIRVLFVDTNNFPKSATGILTGTVGAIIKNVNGSWAKSSDLVFEVRLDNCCRNNFIIARYSDFVFIGYDPGYSDKYKVFHKD